jgi:cobalamin transport system ATP-binding protein
LDNIKTKESIAMLSAQNMSIGFGAHSIFSAINFLAEPGDIVGLLGVNGIGKSTLLRTIAGLQNRINGNLDINGVDIHALSVSERAKQISIVLTERVFIDNITVKAFITLGRTPYTGWLGGLSEVDEQEVEKVIKVIKLEKLQNRFFNQLSDGEKQKAIIARALCQQTPVMILDEPTAYLDFRNKREILDILKTISSDLKKTIIFSTHDIEASLEYCNKFWIMAETGVFREIKRSDNLRKEVMGALSIPNQTLNS